MLHLISQSPIEHPLLQRLESGDDVIFLENAVFSLNKGHSLSANLSDLITENIFLYVLIEELLTRGISKEELVSGIEVINYSGFVKLTEKNKQIKSWK